MTAFLASCICSMAYYRGDEVNQRSYHVDSEFFLDLTPLQTSVEHEYEYRTATNAYIGAAGSYTWRDLFNFQQAKMAHELGNDFTIHLRYWANMDFDNDFDHFQLGLEYALSKQWSIEVLGTPDSKKEFADIGGALIWHNEKSRLRNILMFPNFVYEGKNDYEAWYVKQPVNLQLDWLLQATDRMYLIAAVDWDFPSETTFDSPELNADFESEKIRLDLVYDLNERQKLRLEYQSETTDKNRWSFNEAVPDDFAVTRDVTEIRFEYIRTLQNAQRIAAGCLYANFSENNEYPNYIEASVDNKHISRLLYFTWRRPLSNIWNLKSAVYCDFVDHTETYPDAEDQSTDSSGFEGKLPMSLECCGDNWRIEGGVAVQLDKFSMSGGFMRAAFEF